jgi:L-glyceraldehyde 3-phosphate reductase
MNYEAAENRYESMTYARSGRSGLQLPKLSVGLWHKSFDAGITHFDLANNYGPPAGSAEINFGTIMAGDLKPHRDELIISTKAGYQMWDGPYGEFGSRKYMLASLDQSLARMGLDYVDIFYSHRFDPDTPLEETMGALDSAVRSGRALYVGISSYGPDKTREAATILRSLGTPCVIHQPSYSMFNRWIENGLLDVLGDEGIGCIPFSPLAQGLLSTKYLDGIPGDSRAAEGGSFQPHFVNPANIVRVQGLNAIAAGRGQTLAQMAISWVLRDPRVTTALIGASRWSQITDCIGALDNTTFSTDELTAIDEFAIDGALNLWHVSSDAG